MRERKWERHYSGYAEFYQDAYGQHITALHQVGSVGATLLEADQAAGDWSDAPSPDLVVGWQSSGHPTSGWIDLGAGRFTNTHRRGDAILVAPGAGNSIVMGGAHRCRLASIPYARLRAFVGADQDRLPLDGDFGRLHAALLRDASLTELLERFWIEASSDGPNGALFSDGLLLQLIALLLRLQTAPQPAQSKGGLASWQARRTTEFLKEHLAENVGLPELAAISGLSTFHFARAFKESTGLPPYAYLRRLRLDRARTLLVETDLPVTEIALAVGYESSQALARLFQREVGVSPSRYRRERP